MKIAILAVLPLLLSQNIISAEISLENTLENREAQAERYLEVNSAREIFQDIAARTQNALPESERESFLNMLTKHLDLEVLNDTMSQSLIKHFTAKEIAVLADFYSQPEAKSAMSKMGIYMADIMPVVQMEMIKAQQKAIQKD